MKPADYEKPQPVRDYEAERGIKWNAIVQGLIFSSIVGTVGVGFTLGNGFVDSVLTRFDTMNGTLTEIRDLIGEVNTKAELNTRDIENHKSILMRHEKDISKNSQSIYQLRGER